MARVGIQMFVIAVILAVTAIAPTAARAQAAIHHPFHVSIGELPLSEALKTLAEQGDFQIVFTAEAVKDRTSPQLTGLMQAEEALATLLAGTELEFVRVGNAFVVRAHQSGLPVAAAMSRADGMLAVQASASSASNTRYTRLAQADTAAQQPATEPARAEPDAAVQTVTVTGSRLGSATIAEEGSAPVEVITVEEIRQGGSKTVFEAIESQPMFAGAADNDTRAGATDTKEVNLRGLGAEYTLVLINGRRVGDNNLNLVPFAAVERVEILKDGASAVYGSDALAGVVNVILREKFDGFETDFSYGNTTHFGDGGRTNASFISGVSGDRGSFMLSGQYEKQNPILSLEHPLGRTDDERVFGGNTDWREPQRNPGIITLLSDGSTVMLGPDFAAGETGTTAADYVSPYERLLAKRRPNYLQNDREVATIFARGSYDLLDERVVAYADFLHKSGNIDYIDHRGTFLNYTVPAANYWNPFGEDVSVTYQLDYGTDAGRLERPLESMTSDLAVDMITAGFRGDIGPVNYDLAYSSYVVEDAQSHVGLSRAGIIAQLARTDEGALNLFGNAAVTPEQLEPARAVFGRVYRDSVRSVTGVAQFSPFAMPAGEIEAAVGFEFRSQSTSTLLDEALNIFGDAASLTFLNDSSFEADRDVDAYFAEVLLPLASEESNLPGVHDLALTMAARTEKFSDFGDATVKRATLRWEPFESGVLAVRASYSESFYAPNLADLVPFGDTNVDPYQDPLILDDEGNPLIYDMETTEGGNPDLNPTEGEYVNLGFIFKPAMLPSFTFTTDLWRLEQTEAFIFPDEQSVINGVSPGIVIRAPDALPGEPIGRIITVINRVENAATRNVEGIDFNATYTSEPGRLGRWSIGSYNTYTTKFEYDQRDGLGVQSALGLLTDFDAVPRLRSNLVLRNEFGPWGITMGTSYFGHVENTYDEGKEVEAYVKTDLTVVYDFAKRDAGGTTGLLADTRVALNVDNVFDTDPPFVGSYNNRGLLSNYSYIDYVGQFVTLSFSKSF